MVIHASARPNGAPTPSPVEERELYSQLLRLRDAVITGKHPQFKLPPAAIEQLRASLAAMNAAVAVTEHPMASGLINGLTFNASAVSTNNAQHATYPTLSNVPGLPGLHTPSSSSKAPVLKPSSSGLDPIFLEKADSLVRAEGQLKRQRIERELQSQLEQRKPGLDKVAGTAQDPSPLDVDAILLSSQARETHVSGLKPPQLASPASSFDTNDYYSSQVESEWSSPASASKGSDRAAGAFTADFEHVGEPSTSSFAADSNSRQTAVAHNLLPPSAKERPVQVNYAQFGNAYAADDDEDDEYTPPDVAAFNSFREHNTAGLIQATPLDDDDNSDYEPGEVTQGINVSPPYYQPQQAAQPSPQVPVIRNHLTHIAAPQPNRVSPLAVAKGPSIELELVNGRPEVVRKHQQHAIQSRASTVSPANGIGPNNSNKKKRREKKRKREPEPSSRGKRKREKQHASQLPTSPMHQEPRIKDEPVSPPPFTNISEIQPYTQRTQYSYQPAEIDLVSPRHMQPQVVYTNEPLRSSLRYEYAAPASPAVARIASPATLRPAQRDKQDLRRVASLHNLQRPLSPSNRAYSPSPYRTASLSYADPRLRAAQAALEPESTQYQERPPQENVRYVRADRSLSPPRLQQYQDLYARAQSPAVMPPPTMAPGKIVVDQYGNQYYAAEPVPAPTQVHPRASVAPVDRRPPVDLGYERAASRIGTAHDQPSSNMQYEQSDIRMAPPPVPRRPAIESQSAQYLDSTGYRVRDYDMRPAEQIRYVDSPSSPTYQQPPRYEQMPPPTVRNREATSPVYTPTRSYSVRPEDIAPHPMAYAPRQASVAPVQYVRQDAPPTPARAMSVAPGYEQPPASYTRAYGQATQHVQYVDQYGRPVFPGDLRQLSRYQ